MSQIDALLAARYGTGPAPLTAAAPLAPLLAHRSVRAYRADPVDDATLDAAIAAAQSAATSSNLQCWSVIAVRDAGRRARFAELAGGQAHVAQAPLLLLWVLDLSRLRRLGAAQGEPTDGLDYLEMFTVGAVDVALAAQNAAVAFETLGLGICYIGGMRNHPEQVAELAGLPPLAFVLFGMTVGVPDPDALPAIKPRLPQAVVLHQEHYGTADETARIAAYDTRFARASAAAGREGRAWSPDVTRRVGGPHRLSGRDRLRDALAALGFALR